MMYEEDEAVSSNIKISTLNTADYGYYYCVGESNLGKSNATLDVFRKFTHPTIFYTGCFL